MSERVRVGLFIPVLNPGIAEAERLGRAIASQSLRPNEIVVADSESTDGAPAVLAKAIGGRILPVRRAEFDHGGTRNLAFASMDVDVYVFLTQDAIPADARAFERLVRALVADPVAGIAYGRQLPHIGAGPFATHARLFNYPPQSDRRTRDDIERLGIRTAFCSNSFSAYRGEAMRQIGGFPERMIFGEDTAAVARLLERGWSSLYVAEAAVYHSHDYSLREEFARYFDAGAFHTRERWYTSLLSGATGEGMRFVRSELEFVRTQAGTAAAAAAVVRNGVRWMGYRTGRAHRVLPRSLRRKIGMNRGYWKLRGA